MKQRNRNIDAAASRFGQPSRRSVLLGAGALLTGTALAGHAKAQEPAKMRISWWGSDDRHQKTLKLIKLWESRNPGVTMSAQYGGLIGYQDKLSTEFAGRNAPDIMQISDNRPIPHRLRQAFAARRLHRERRTRSFERQQKRA